MTSLNRPGGNITGLNYRNLELTGKRLEMLKDAGSTLTHVAVLVNPGAREFKGVPGQFEPEARALGLRVQRVEASDPSAFDAIFASMEQSGVDALMIMDHSLFNAYRQQLLALALRHRLPTVYAARAYAEAGCLMAYAPNLAQMGRRAATYIDKILKGAKPADLPVEQPMKFEFGINLKTAQTLGLTILPTLLFQADEVIR